MHCCAFLCGLLEKGECSLHLSYYILLTTLVQGFPLLCCLMHCTLSSSVRSLRLIRLFLCMFALLIYESFCHQRWFPLIILYFSLGSADFPCRVRSFNASVALHIKTPHNTIKLICSCNDSAVWPLSFFWMDMLLNVFSADSLLSTKAALLSIRRGLHCSTRFWALDHPIIVKYAIREYTFTPSVVASDLLLRCHPTLCCCRVCTIVDHACLYLTFDDHHALPSDGGNLLGLWRLSDVSCISNCITVVTGPPAPLDNTS